MALSPFSPSPSTRSPRSLVLHRAGILTNEVFSNVLKRIIKQPRPPGTSALAAFLRTSAIPDLTVALCRRAHAVSCRQWNRPWNALEPLAVYGLLCRVPLPRRLPQVRHRALPTRVMRVPSTQHFIRRHASSPRFTGWPRYEKAAMVIGVWISTALVAVSRYGPDPCHPKSPISRSSHHLPTHPPPPPPPHPPPGRLHPDSVECT